ncbi:MAG: nucleotidyltransferase domain-containing protein [Rhodomicrobium sp.]
MSKLIYEPSIPAVIAEEIETRLVAIEREENARILFAIESGSRAWGFPSPDSDYDVRFVYAHPVDWYLSLEPGRDVIEKPTVENIDINGWDIHKALNLLLKPNPVLLEWLSSPVRYRWDSAIADQLIALSRKITHGRACAHHYLHLADRQWKAYIEGKDFINLKKYFYAVRPAMALRWLRLHPDIAPPMNMQTLAKGLDLSLSLISELEMLLQRKGQSKELGLGARISTIDTFVQSELDWARNHAEVGAGSRSSNYYEEAEALFRLIVKVVPA